MIICSTAAFENEKEPFKVRILSFLKSTVYRIFFDKFLALY